MLAIIPNLIPMIPLAGIINYALISLLCLSVLTASFNFGLSCDLAVCDTKWAEMKNVLVSHFGF